MTEDTPITLSARRKFAGISSKEATAKGKSQPTLASFSGPGRKPKAVPVKERPVLQGTLTLGPCIRDTGFLIVNAVAHGAAPPHRAIRIDRGTATLAKNAVADGQRFPLLHGRLQVPRGALDAKEHDVASMGMACACDGDANRPCPGMWAAAFQAIARPVAAPPDPIRVPDLMQPCPQGHVAPISLGGYTITKWGKNQRYLCHLGKHRYNRRGLLSYRRLEPTLAAHVVSRHFRTGRVGETVDEFQGAYGATLDRQFIQRAGAEVLQGLRALRELHPFQTSGIWVADETQWGQAEGKPWICTVMDEGTRMVLSAHLAPKSDQRALTQALRDAAVNVGPPRILVTDGHRGYAAAVQELGWRCLHLEAHERTKTNAKGQKFYFNGLTNRVERSHLTIKGLLDGRANHADPSRLLRDLQQAVALYNYLRPSQANEGQTPAERAGLHLQAPGWPRYRTVIEYALHVGYAGGYSGQCVKGQQMLAKPS